MRFGPRSILAPFCEKRSRGRLYLLFQTHGLHLKKIDGLGLRVFENRGSQATTEHQRGVDVDAIGLHVRLSNRRMTMDDILFVRRLVLQKQVANPHLVRIILLFQPDAWPDIDPPVAIAFGGDPRARPRNSQC